MTKITTRHYLIRLDEADHQHRLTLAALAGILQETAWDASVEIGLDIPTLLKEGLTWVLSRMRIEMKNYPKYAQTITLETYAPLCEKYYMQRDFKITDEKKNLLGIATSNWMVIDSEKKKLISVPAFIKDKYLVLGKPALPTANERLEELSHPDFEYTQQVRWNHLDINQHTNNKHYFRWLMDCLPEDLLNKQQVQKMDIQFKADSSLNDVLWVQSGKMPATKSAFLHRITQQADNKELIRAYTLWE